MCSQVVTLGDLYQHFLQGRKVFQKFERKRVFIEALTHEPRFEKNLIHGWNSRMEGKKKGTRRGIGECLCL
jgi:hypothetical protein